MGEKEMKYKKIGLGKLEGKWFHTINDDGFFSYQGQILEVYNDSYFLAQLYSFVMGEPTDKRLMRFNELTLNIYETNKEMKDFYILKKGSKR